MTALLHAWPLAAAIFRVDGVAGADGPGCGSELAPCATIQQAVNLASSGDTILVAEAVYTGNASCLAETAVVCVLQKELTILGGFASGNWDLQDPVNNTTVIDGQNTRRGLLVLRSGPNPALPATSLRLEGFTVRNGRGVGTPNGVGGGLKANFADITLRDMVFEDNVALGGSGGLAGGGGVAVLSNSDNVTEVILERSLFQNNHVTGGGGTGGAALGGGLLVDHAVVTASGLDFQNNSATGGASASAGRDGLGGGLSFSFGVTAVVRNLTAVGNTATGGSASSTGGHAFGGAFFVEGAESPAGNVTVVTLLDSSLSDNTALGGNAPTAGGGAGGAIDTFGTQFTMERTLVIDNHAEGGVGSVKGFTGGGGLYLEWPFNSVSPVHVLRNSIIADNTINGGQGGGGGLRLLAVTATVSHVTFVNNQLFGVGFGPGILVGPRPPQPSNLTLSYSIVADHTVPASGHALYVQAIPPTGSTANLTNRNHFVGNSNNTNLGFPNAGTFVGFPGSNIQDPAASTFFVNPAGFNYHVDGTQPPTNSATGSSEALDVDGAVRTGTRDLGADEFGVAAFQLTVGKIGTGSGTVISSPGGISCGLDCFEAYAENTVVNLNPMPGVGSYFFGWSGDADCTDSSLLMNQDRSCTAQFVEGVAPCTVAEIDLVLSNQTVNTTETEAACNSITAGPAYTVGAPGNVTFEAPNIILTNGFSVQGTFTAINATP